MTNKVPNDCTLVKLAVAILDDPHGVKKEALDALTDLVAEIYGPRSFPMFDKILKAVDGCDDRVFLPEDWNANGSKTKTR